MDTSVIERYVKLRKEITALEEEINAIKPVVIERLQHQGRRAYFDDYELRLNIYYDWQYSPTVIERQKQLNDLKREERESGRALLRERRDMLVLKRIPLQEMPFAVEK